jgi:cytoskeletal protein CcmA (bactofilin family)
MLFVAPVWAVEIYNGNTVTIPEGKITGPLFVSGNYVVINADVNGDVFAAGQSVVLNGKVDGDFIGAGSTVRINGSVNGNVRTAGKQVEINGQVERSLTGMGDSVNLGSTARIKNDALLFANSIQIYGTVEGQALGGGNEMRLDGPIGGDVRIWGVQSLSLGPSAVIGGTMVYTSANQADISPQARVNGITQLAPPAAAEKSSKKAGFPWLGTLISFLAGVLLWGVVYLLFPPILPGLGRVGEKSPWPVLGWGFLGLLVTPLAVLILLVTVIGIPLAIILLVVYIFTLLSAKIIVGDALGRYLSRHFKWEGRMPFILSFCASYLILIFLSKIPVAGFFVSIIISSVALGMLALYFYRWRKDNKPHISEDLEIIK